MGGENRNPPEMSRFDPAGYYLGRRTIDSPAKWGHERSN